MLNVDSGVCLLTHWCSSVNFVVYNSAFCSDVYNVHTSKKFPPACIFLVSYSTLALNLALWWNFLALLRIQAISRKMIQMWSLTLAVQTEASWGPMPACWFFFWSWGFFLSLIVQQSPCTCNLHFVHFSDCPSKIQNKYAHAKNREGESGCWLPGKEGKNLLSKQTKREESFRV